MFKDPILKKLIDRYPAPSFTDRSGSLMQSLIRSVINQQLSQKAADTITLRFISLFEEVSKDFPGSKDILDMDDEKLRSCGISYSKVSYIKAIARAFYENSIDPENLKNLDDEEVISELIKIKGVGRWTAEMTLIFSLKRPDVFSMGDLGLRRAIERLYGVTKMSEILTLSEQWKPYRSTACWYLWRSLENDPVK